MELTFLAGQKRKHPLLLLASYSDYVFHMGSACKHDALRPELAPLGCQLGFNLCQSSLCLVQSPALGLHYLDHAAIHVQSPHPKAHAASCIALFCHL